MWKTHVKEIVLWGIFIIAFIIIASTSYIVTNPQTRNTTSTEAASVCKCTDDDVCYPDGCSRKPKSDNNTFDEARYDNVCKQFDPGYRMPDALIQHFCSVEQPSCCYDIAKYKDDRMCCFQERWTCHPSLCKGASGNGDCGKYWHLPDNGWKTYGCVKEGPNGDEVPYWGLPPGLPGGGGETNPTAPPQATAVPTNPPTATPRQNNTTQPTATPSQQNNNNGGTPGGTNTSQSGVTRYPINPPTATPSRAQQNNTNTSNNSLNQPTGQLANQNNDGSFNGTNADGNSDEVLLPGLQTPNIQLEMPKIEIKAPNEILRAVVNPSKIEELNNLTNPPLMAAERAVVTIRSYDKQLENTVEGWIFYIRDRILSLL